MCNIKNLLQCLCSGRPTESPSNSLCCSFRDRNTILRNSSTLEVHYGPLKRPEPHTPRPPDPQTPRLISHQPRTTLVSSATLKAEWKCEICMVICTAQCVGAGVATSRVVRLVVRVVGVEVLGEIYKVWSVTFKGKDVLLDIDTDDRVTSRM